MKLYNAFCIWQDLPFTFWTGLKPTLGDIFKQLSLLLSPTALAHVFMAHLWAVVGEGLDEGHRETKQNIITRNASGVVLDIGAGYGHSARYLDRLKVTKYVALEPNTYMHAQIRTRVNEAGFTESDGSLVILSLGAQDTDAICAALGSTQPVDTIVSILTLCSVPNTHKAIVGLLEKVLKPGGVLVYFEHVKNPREDVAWWQWFWNPVWGIVFGGCRMDVATDVWIDEWKGWEEKSVVQAPFEEGEEERLLTHRLGRYVKGKE